ncbi:hypothetical protein [Acinetobacter modestus]|uniref:hypothetical protein n=1 Tax=Acinetobacter modestus TaxID=1776740 RepID=UPI003019B04F
MSNDYTPPDVHNIVFNFTGEAYTPPDTHNVVFNFGGSSSQTSYITVPGSNQSTIGTPISKPAITTIFINGFDAFRYGGQSLIQTKFITPSGFNSQTFSTPTIWNFKKELKPIGFLSLTIPTHKIYNLKQPVVVQGINSLRFGTAYMQGGVKYLIQNGFNSLNIAVPKVVNTRADQYVNLANGGISTLEIPSPKVSPRMLYASGFVAFRTGNPIVQKNPSPKGFVSTSYGTHWITLNPRLLQPISIDSLNLGFPKIFDPTRKVNLTEKGISGGIFGDILIKNKNKYIYAAGFLAQELSIWTNIETNLRVISNSSFDSSKFGLNTIKNKTPSIQPVGFDSFSGLSAHVGYRIRFILPNGFDLKKFGEAKLTKPPELKSSGFNSNEFGNAYISNKVRYISVSGSSSFSSGSQTAWFKVRSLKQIGSLINEFGQPRVEHSARNIYTLGTDHAVFSHNSWFSYGKRKIEPLSIYVNFASNHLVGGTRYIHQNGFVATLFGARIIPEIQNIYTIGFSNLVGSHLIDSKKKYVQTKGFISVGTEPQHRWGNTKVNNLRQYITQLYDSESGLVPPKMNGWTNIQNKNRIIGAIGNNLSKVSKPNIENKARQLLTIGFDAHSVSIPMISDKIRHIRSDGFDSSYLARWSIVRNSARVISTKGKDSQIFGYSGITNTRRYFQRIGRFESLEMGLPFIADRIRTLTFERRYTIGPPIIPLPKVELLKRYIDEVKLGEVTNFGNSSLTIHFNKITPRWVLQDRYGIPIIKNLTPELLTVGHSSEVHGNANLRTQWRELSQKGIVHSLFGRSDISFKTKKITTFSYDFLRFGLNINIIKSGAPPYVTQFVYLNIQHGATGTVSSNSNGDGIEIPTNQVPAPTLRTNTVNVRQYSHFTEFGLVKIYANTIRVEPGYQDMTIGDHKISLKNIQIKTQGIESSVIFGDPIINPRFIRVNSFISTEFSTIKVNYFHRRINVIGNLQSKFDLHKIDLKKKIVKPNGFNAYRTGWNMFSHDLVLEQFDSNDSQEFGVSTISFLKGRQIVNTLGIYALQSGHCNVDNQNKDIRLVGFDSLKMGNALQNDKPFMWQGLRVGPLITGNYGDFESLEFGSSMISLKIRELKLSGFDSFVCDYELSNFNKRMRVTRTNIPKPVKYLSPVGFDAFSQGVPNIKPAVHYIRPDGNADQFRKGGF